MRQKFQYAILSVVLVLVWSLIALAIFFVFIVVGCAKNALEDEPMIDGGMGGNYIATKQMIAPAAPVEMAYDESYVDSTGHRGYYPEYEQHYGSGEDIEVELKIIRMASIGIEVEDYFLASQKVEAYASKYGGYVSNSNARSDQKNRRSGQVTIKDLAKELGI